jgi:hypothetical protein
MKRKFLSLTATAALTLAGNAFAAPMTYEFETITEINMHISSPSLTGVLRNTTTPTTVSFWDNTGDGYRWALSRCLPLFMAMVEKPGKYYLVFTQDPAISSLSTVGCKLQVR